MDKLLILLTLLLSLSFSQISCSQENNTQNKIDTLKQDSIFSITDSIEIDTLIMDEDYFNHTIDSASLGINFFPKGNYISLKKTISAIRIDLKNKYLATKDSFDKQQIIDSARYIFTDYLLNNIIPFWYGTEWDFNGYTNTPNKGVIACGYFVSTTLKHMGLNIDRYKLAQQAPHNEAKTFEPDSNLLYFNTDTIYEIYDIFNFYKSLESKLKPGLYFVGLYNHVGFLFSRDNKLYFIHSNYIDGYVMIERIFESNAFKSSFYYIADITHNDDLIRKWILNSTVKVNVK
ncbi:MAG: hypothetical protein K8R54_12125 [Bacteroidales bacterium]|nr:hypothetical protein [Bacteroidales bacterium]